MLLFVFPDTEFPPEFAVEFISITVVVVLLWEISVVLLQMEFTVFTESSPLPEIVILPGGHDAVGVGVMVGVIVGEGVIVIVTVGVGVTVRLGVGLIKLSAVENVLSSAFA